MSNKVKGTLAGAALSLAAIVLWIILSYIGIIAGLAGALMGILFTIGYKRFNKNDKSKYVIFAACILIVAEIIVAELLVIAIAASGASVSFSEALEIDEVKSAVIFDIVVGLILSFAVFAGYLVSSTRKSKLNDKRIYTRPPEPAQPQNTDVFDKPVEKIITDPFETAQDEPQNNAVVQPYDNSQNSL